MTGLRQVWVLVAHELRRRWRSLLIWGVALGALGALYVALYPTMSRYIEDYMENAPGGMGQYFEEFGGSMSVEQWLGSEFRVGIAPIALSFLVIIMGARAIAGSEDRKTLDLLLSNPLRRSQVVVGSLGAMALSLAGVLVIVWILTYIAALIVGVDLGPGRLAMALVALWPLCLVFGALALLVSASVRRAAIAIAVPGVVVVIMYVVESLAEAIEAVRPYRVISLFYHLGYPMEGDFPWTAVLLMLVGAGVLGAAAVAAFARRDVYT
ncbi:MAG: ABC transporter permease subunit [Thermoleophilia bacterium]|nr:ABC transporter permease subunit [Thermoleophilia bacterium]